MKEIFLHKIYMQKSASKIKVLEEWDNWPTNNNAFTYNEIMR